MSTSPNSAYPPPLKAPLKAVTLWPEWAYAFWRLGKDGENRTWPMNRYLIGQPLGIHAGVRPVLKVGEVTTRGEELAAFYRSLETIALPTNRWPTDEQIDLVRGHIVSVVVFTASTQRSRSPWAAGCGQYFWPAMSMFHLPEPVKVTGAQGIWNVPESVRDLIQRQMPATAAAERH